LLGQRPGERQTEPTRSSGDDRNGHAAKPTTQGVAVSTGNWS
jgi:hypothetical protein